MILKKGDKGSSVAKLRSLLNLTSGNLFDQETEVAVRIYQKSKGLSADGIIGTITATSLGFNPEGYLSTDISTSSSQIRPANPGQDLSFYDTHSGLRIYKSYLDKDEYISGTSPKQWLALHHTAGGHDPHTVIRQWNDDTRGRIATQFVIGGISTTNGSDMQDGRIVECFPDKDWAYHLGENGSSHLHPESVALEICNWGYLTKGGYTRKQQWIAKDPDRFYNYTGGIIPDSMICDLTFKFKGHQYYHLYTDKQLESLIRLSKEIASRHPKIDLKAGLHQWISSQSPNDAFEFKKEAYNGTSKGVFSHSNIRADKTDLSPQPKLIQALQSL